MSDDPLTPAYIERLRVEAGMRVGELCAIAGVHRTVWWRWRTGRFNPSIAIVRKLRDAALSAKEAAE